MITVEGARWYLAALIDGEGCVAYNVKNGYREVAIYNTSDLILDFAEECLTLLGIRYNRHPRIETVACQEIRITRREELIKVADLIPLQSVKAQRLQDLLETYTTTLEEYRSREWQSGSKRGR